eukprot:g10226.t1
MGIAVTILFYGSLACIFLSYAGYPLLLAVWPFRRRHQVGDELPSVSLIINAYNEAAVIEAKIENALDIDYPADKLEVVVISDESDDGTDEIVERFTDPRIVLFRQSPRRGKSAGLTEFIPRTSGTAIVFSDANSMYEPDAIRKLMQHFADANIGYVVGQQRYVSDPSDVSSAESSYWKYETWIKEQESRVGSVVGGDGAISAIRRELFRPLRDDDISDFTLPLQIIAQGYRGVYEPDAVCHEKTATSFRGEFRRKSRIVNRSLRAVLRTVHLQATPRVAETLTIIFWIAAAISGYLIVVYPSIVFLAARFARDDTSASTDARSVTLIIPARNEAAIIEAKLKNAIALDYPNELLQIILASDGSHDDTTEIAERFSDEGVQISRSAEWRGKTLTLCDAVKQANGELICLCDANVMFKPDALKRMVARFGDQRVGAVSGEVRLASHESNFGAGEDVYYQFERAVQRGESRIGSMMGVDGGMYVIRKELFQPLPPDTILDDFVISMRVIQQGYRVVYEPEAVATENGTPKAAQEFRRRIRVAAGAMQSMKRRQWPPLRRPIELWQYLSHKLLRWFGPVWLVLLLVSNVMLWNQGVLYKCSLVAQSKGNTLNDQQAGKRVAIFGMGYVGCVTGACLARDGHTVIGVDIDPAKVATINSGNTPVSEPGLAELVAEQVAVGRLSATTELAEAVAATDIALIAVGTPSGRDGSVTTSAVEHVVSEIGGQLAQSAREYTIVIRSTVLPGVLETKIAPLIEERLGESLGHRISLCNNPEFLREASAIRDYDTPPFVVVGASEKKAANEVFSLYESISAEHIRTDTQTAAMVKYACNAFHAVKIGFANEIGALARSMGADGQEVMRIVCRDTQLNISPAYLRPGFAFGGSCLPKDVRALNRYAQRLAINTDLLQSILPSNTAHVERALELIRDSGSKKVGLVGLSFKAGTDDLRESPQVTLAETLVGKGYELRIYDPGVRPANLIGSNLSFIEQHLPHLAALLVDRPEDLVDHSELVLIATGVANDFDWDGKFTGRIVDLQRFRGQRFAVNVFDLIQTDSEHATPSEPTTRQMVLQEADLEQFAEWSGDRNPLHVDSAMAKQTFFGRTIAHGVLGAIRALSSRPTSQRRYLKSVDIEFRGAVIPDAPCEVNWEFHEGIEKTQVCSDTDTLMSIQSEFVEAPQDGISTDQISEFSDDRFAMPVDRRADEVETGMEFTGRYQTPADIPSCLTDALVPLQLRVFALCSYLVGMELPGLRSLFTRLTLDFQNIESDSRSLTYNLRVSRFDAHFRILDTELTVETPSGDLIATGTLRSYFRFTPCATDLSQLQHAVGAHTAELNDRVALVIGGNRGLGGDITAGLALAGCRVIASYRSSSEAAEALAEQLKDRNADVEFVRGDAGDPEWCAGIVDQILNEYGRIDLLVLNACEPPRPVDWNHQTSTDFADYIGRNLSLATNPLRAALPALEKSGGTIVAVSSSFVDELPEEFPQYIALKQAVENAVRSACNGAEGLSAIIARPPRLQTSWNDTPTGVLGTLPSERAAVALIRAVAHASTPGHAELLTEFPEVERSADREQEDTASSLSIALAATFTADPILPGLQFWFDELSLAAAPAIAPYGQVLQELLNPTSLLSSNQQGVNIVLIRVGDWLRELDADELESASDWQNHLESAADELVGAVQSHRQHAAVDTILMLCPSDASEFAVDGNFREIEARIAERLTGTIGLQVVRLADFHQRFSVGESDIHDPLRNEIGHIPYRDPYYQVMATVVARNIHRRLVTPRKVVVVDCDNTLWRGVVGEIGPEGVGFDEGHLELHQALIRLNESGVLLALCSKNEAEDVWSVFDTRSDFALNRDRIVTSMINWNAKSENLRTLSERLNLGLDSFIFIDDNPVECAEVQAGCPEVLTLQWPQEPDRALNLLQHTWELDPRQGTREDQKRTQLYQEEFSRQELQSNTQTFRDFIKSLKLDIQIAPLAIDDLPRASQLTLRTNQFNFTTRRRNESEVRSLINSEQHAIRSVKVRDRFGDYGFVGLLIAERQSETLDVDTFLLSCRVLGRGVEHRMAAELGRMASESDLQTVRLTIRFTDRNEPARKFLSSILSEDYQKLDRDSLACTVPRDVMSAVEFQPDDGAAVSGKSAKNTSHSSLSAGPATSSREREQQVYRTAYELNTAAALQSAVAVVNDGSAAQKGLEPDVDIEDVVYSAFSKSLRISEEEIRREDRLEALRCDSFKIVEITVALAESFPWLPSTLLFEHRSVSEIVERVRELSADSEPGLAHNRSLQVIGSSSETPDTNYDVAVVGIDVRCGGAGSPEELWSLLSEGRSAVRRVSKDRPAFLRLLEQDRPYWASLLDDVEGFDADFFGIAPREAKMMDPQLRLILQVAWGALEDAGLVGTNHLPDTGVFTGVMYHDYAQAANSAARHANSPYRCWEGFSLANRVSQLFDFHGPSIAVDTACSSSGTALHLACQALHIGECKAAIVAGVNLILDTNRFAHLGQLGILSDTGACRAFGSEANGTVLGEGAGVVVLRPLREARDRGDRIYGVIKGTALNSGTGTVGFTAPHPGAQSEAIRAAVARSGIDPRTISYVETHGTGTALGDPIEIRGLTLGYLDKQLWTDDISGSHVCRIGSIKPNIGHLEAGAGILGLIKILLQLQHRQLVPSLTSDETNPQIPFDDVPFEVSRGLQPWEAPVFQQNDRTVTYPRRAGLSSFGVGGANSHVIVEEAMDVAEVNESQEPAIERPVHLLVLSARHEETLQEQATRLREYLIAHPDVSLGDVAQTLTTCREHFERRTAIVAPDNESAVAELQAIRPADNDQFDKQPAGDPRVAFLFTGQGSQHARMGRELYETSPVFRATIDRCAAILEEHLEHPLLDVLFAEEGSEQAALVHQTAYTQPCLFAVEFASYELWKSWGVEPVSVLGHSIGEIVALCAAGALTLEDGLKLVAARGRLMQAIPAGGSMVSVRADESTVRRILSTNDAGVDVAAVNSPQQTVISGESKPVAEVVERFSREGIKTTALTVSHAFHSSLMEPMLEEFEAIAASVSVVDPQIPVISCVTGETLTQADITSGYWSRQVRDSVCFTDALHALDKLNIDAYVETGPQPILSGLGQTTLADQQRLWLPDSTAINGFGIRQVVESQVVAADVSFQDGVDRIFNAVDRQAAPLRGVFHAAGIDCVQPIADMTLETLEHMLASKVTGGRLLHEATLKRELDMFVMFSSFTSVFGSAGRAHYGAANAFLDALAVSRQAAGLPATVINWGPWSGGGMATPESLQMLERMGNRGLDVASALSALEHVISRNISQAVVADIDWPQFRAVYEARGKRPLISEVSNFPESAPSAVHLNHNGWIPRLLQSSEADRHAALTELLQSEVADILGFGDPDEVQPDRDLFELGMDSLTAVELTNRIQRNLTLSEGGYLLDEPQIDRLAKRLIEEVDFEQAGDQTAERATKEQKNGRPQPSWTVQLQQRDAAGRCEELTSLLRGEVAAILGYDEPEEIPLDKNLVELGMDSLTAVEFTRRLERNLGLENAVQVFDFENLAVLAEHLAGETTSDQGDRNGVTKFVRGLEASTYEFAKIAWPTRRDDWIVPRWDWMYLESAARMKVEPRVWLYQDGDAVVGHHGGIPVNLQVGQQTHGTVWLVETMVREEYRKQAVGSRLLIQAKQELPFTLSLGQTAQMREILIRLGWRQVAPLETWMLPLNFAKVVADKLPMRVLAGPAGIAMKLQQFAKRSLGGPSAQGCQVSRLDRFDERHDDLWERVGGEYPCAVVRDASYLNWKYVDQPGQEFIRLELSREGKPVAIATLMVRDPDNAYSYRRAFLVDLVVSPTDRALHFAVFDEVCNACRELQADALFFHFINDSIRASVRREISERSIDCLVTKSTFQEWNPSMCGIVGYTGLRTAQEFLISGLRRLEYRGYDSAGITTLADGQLQTRRSVGRVQRLASELETDTLAGQIGIAHTRWATHGKPSIRNAHPHLDYSQRIALVHNGVIENHAAIREFLTAEGIEFASETDTEVLAQLIGYYYDRHDDFLDSVRAALHDVQGTFGAAILCSDHPESLIAARRGSPLIVGFGKSEALVASDPQALVGYTGQVTYLEDNELVVVTPEQLTASTIDAKPVQKTLSSLDLTLEEIELGDYEHHMLKEIHEQPESLTNTMRGRLNGTRDRQLTLGGLDGIQRELARYRRVLLFACGTAWHAALIGKYLFEELARIPCSVEYASELRYRNPVVEEGTLAIAVSQSGETADTLAALDEVRMRGATVLGVVNVVGSSIARETDAGMYLHVGPEIGVASTKAFTAQVAVLTMMAADLGRRRHLSADRLGEVLDELTHIPQKVAEAMETGPVCRKLADEHCHQDNWLYLGRGVNFPVALEGALKLKEISYIHAEGLPAAEMKHGPIAMIDDGVPVVVIATRDHTYDKVLSNIEEVKSRGGFVIAVAEENDNHIGSIADAVIPVPSTLPVLSPLVNVIPLQFLAYYSALARGCDVDKPRNLAKSVTVE